MLIQNNYKNISSATYQFSSMFKIFTTIFFLDFIFLSSLRGIANFETREARLKGGKASPLTIYIKDMDKYFNN